jgi:PAS domain S-box-containing protein
MFGEKDCTAGLKDASGRLQEVFLEALNRFSCRVSGVFSLEKVCSYGLEGIIETVGPDLAFMFLKEKDELVLQRIVPEEAAQRLGTMPRHRKGECLCGIAADEKRPVFSLDIHADNRCTWEECKLAGIRSAAVLPLKREEEILGVVGIASFTERDFERHEEFLETLASQMAIAVSNARLFEEQKQELALRREAEDALRRSEEKYRTLVENAGEAIFVAQDFGLKFVNRRCTDITGYSADELTTIPIASFIHPEDRDMVLTRHAQRVQGLDVPSSYSFRLITKAGDTRWVSLNAVLVEWEGRPATLNFMADITDRMALEAQLLQAQKMESIGRLAGGVAHDFNNMLQAIMGYCELCLMESGPDKAVNERLRQIKEAAIKASDLTRQLLGFARKQPIMPKTIDLNEAVAGTVKMLRRLIGEDIELVLKPGPNLWPVLMDPVQLDQILANLCVNARDAISGVGTITIETANVVLDSAFARSRYGLEPGGYVLLQVSDTGSGMEEELLPHIFEPFFTTKEKGKGTGLGLATVYGIVTQNRGAVEVRSKPGLGSTFSIYIPKTDPPAREEHETESFQGLERGSETILLVEDEPMILDIERETLEGCGYRVIAAGSPQEALERAASLDRKLDLLVTDVVMPQMDGMRLKEMMEASHPGIRCLFLSGYPTEVIARRGVIEEGVHFLQKPFTAKALTRKVREALNA